MAKKLRSLEEVLQLRLMREDVAAVPYVTFRASKLPYTEYNERKVLIPQSAECVGVFIDDSYNKVNQQ